MTKRELEQVRRRAEKEPGVAIAGIRIWPQRGGRSYELECVDTITGYPFVVHSREDWDRRAADRMLHN